MSLNQKFKEAFSELTVSISALRHDSRNRIRQAKRLETCHGSQVVLTILEGQDNVISLFLPKTYGDAMEDSDIQYINTGGLQYYLIYRGKIAVSQTLIVDIEL
jgi:hypothetical protein